MPVDFDVVVEIDPDLLPCGQFVVGPREKLELGPDPQFEEFPPRLPIRPHDLIVQFNKLRHGPLSSSEEKNFLTERGAESISRRLDLHLGIGLGLSGVCRNARPVLDMQG